MLQPILSWFWGYPTYIVQKYITDPDWNDSFRQYSKCRARLLQGACSLVFGASSAFLPHNNGAIKV